MESPWLTLKPFAREAPVSTIQLEARATWSRQQLELEFQLRDPEHVVHEPAPTAACERRHGLWQSTCFEAFFSQPGAEHYWELNLAPNGHWNAYRLSGYRTGLQQEAAITCLPYSLRRSPELLELRLKLNLEALVPPLSALELSITSVLACGSAGCSYWAVRHTGSEADFHRRDSFQRLPAGD